MDRNTIISRISDSPMTMIPKGSNASPRRADASMLMAVEPVTSIPLTAYFFSSAGACFRSSSTSAVVAGAV